ncbi:MAG: acyltransferase family protein [Clostridia bacterium]|nr:acyltransferase family protein [Clostridia bacterium]MBO5306196.1 acyltransferase family protein [Clostridia bacterium]
MNALEDKTRVESSGGECVRSVGRNMGVELFRVVSMLLVVLLHIVGRGGVLSATEPLSAQYKIAVFVQVLTYCSVNCYALISGFANVNAGFKFRRFVHLWLETVFLITFLNIVTPLLSDGFTITREWWLNGFFPLAKRELWYLCAYFFMYPLMLLINHGLHATRQWQHIVVIVLLQMPTLFRLIDGQDNYALSGGYSAMWLICLYVMGAYFRIYGAPRWAKWYVTLPVFFISCGIAFLAKIVPEERLLAGQMESVSAWYENREMLISYLSPCMVVMSLMLLLFFMQLKINGKAVRRILSEFGRATWGVFVIHVCSAVWYLDDFWDLFPAIADKSPLWMSVSLVASALLWYFIFSLLSIGRAYLFKLCRADRAVECIADGVAARLERGRRV